MKGGREKRGERVNKDRGGSGKKEKRKRKKKKKEKEERKKKRMKRKNKQAAKGIKWKKNINENKMTCMPGR